MRIHTDFHTVPQQNKASRLSDYLIGVFDILPGRSAVKKAIKKQYILVNNMPASTATFIRGGESIELSLPYCDEQPQKELILKLKVLYEDDYFAAIYKPAGITVSGNKYRTIANALPHNLNVSTQFDATTPKPVHRLDYATTGVLLAGKTFSSIRKLGELFKNREVNKTYYAITIGKMNNSGTISSSIDSKEALTYYKVLNTIESERFCRLNFVELNPKTGRKHQLRIHLSSIGNPILGDKEYGIKNLILKGKGLYLHAKSLEFMHPKKKELVNVETELPKKFKKIFVII